MTHLHDNMFSSVSPDINSEFEEAEVWVWQLQPGDYEFYNFEVRSNSPYSGGTSSSKNDFSIPFTIKAGQTLYLGDFHAYGIEGRNFFGLPVHGGVYFGISDQSARDIPIAKREDPAISAFEVALPNVSAIASPYFRLTP